MRVEALDVDGEAFGFFGDAAIAGGADRSGRRAGTGEASSTSGVLAAAAAR